MVAAHIEIRPMLNTVVISCIVMYHGCLQHVDIRPVATGDIGIRVDTIRQCFRQAGQHCIYYFDCLRTRDVLFGPKAVVPVTVYPALYIVGVYVLYDSQKRLVLTFPQVICGP